MNERDDELFEAELHKLAPARPPVELMAKLAAAIPQRSTFNPQPAWWQLFRWLIPTAAAAVLVGALVWRWAPAPAKPLHVNPATASLKAAPKADEVEIDRQLVALFDAVAQLPSGQPVRFRCREWADEVVLRDPARGLVIERRTPRLEVVPVSFETY
jgi:hypothetical protein